MSTIFDTALGRIEYGATSINETKARYQDKLTLEARAAIVQATDYLRMAREALSQAEIAYAMSNAKDPYEAVLSIIGSKYHYNTITKEQAIKIKMAAVDEKLQKMRAESEKLIRQRIQMERDDCLASVDDTLVLIDEETA